MADISTELQTIQSNAYGENVLTAISSAMTAINTDGVDIASELHTITNGRYGNDIRMAIHDALFKLSEGGGSSEGGPLVFTPYMSYKGISNATVGHATIDPDPIVIGDTIGCSDAYFIGGTVSWNINGRAYATLTSGERVGAVIHFYSGGSYWTTALLLSPIESDVTYSYNTTSSGSLVYEGTTWYVSTANYAWSGQYDDSTGTLLTYPTVILPGTAGYDEDQLKDFLQYTRAFAVTN